MAGYTKGFDEEKPVEKSEYTEKYVSSDEDLAAARQGSEVYPDPDTGKSDEERALLVGASCIVSPRLCSQLHLGQAARTEDRPLAHPVAVISLPTVLP